MSAGHVILSHGPKHTRPLVAIDLCWCLGGGPKQKMRCQTDLKSMKTWVNWIENKGEN